MKYRYLPATVMLSAGAITMFICLYNRYEALYTLKVLLAVLIIFLIIGSLTRKALIKIVDMSKKADGENKAISDVSDENTENDDIDNKNIIN